MSLSLKVEITRFVILRWQDTAWARAVADAPPRPEGCICPIRWSENREVIIETFVLCPIHGATEDVIRRIATEEAAAILSPNDPRLGEIVDESVRRMTSILRRASPSAIAAIVAEPPTLEGCDHDVRHAATTIVQLSTSPGTGMCRRCGAIMIPG
jgi:hypothetical protein